MFVGDRDVTPIFTQSTAATLHGARGLRLMVHQTVLCGLGALGALGLPGSPADGPPDRPVWSPSPG